MLTGCDQAFAASLHEPDVGGEVIYALIGQ